MNALKKIAPKVTRFAAGAASMLLAKLALQPVMESLLKNPYIAYLSVHAIVLALSYWVHIKFTFKQKSSWVNFYSYTKAVILFKVLDYVVFSGVFAYLGISSQGAIISATAALFALRFTVLDKKFGG